MRKRSAYRPKRVDTPVTRGLLDELAQDMHFALMALENGAVSEASWKRVGKVLLIAHIASDGDPRLMGSDDLRLVTSSILTLDAMASTAKRVGVWRVHDFDVASITGGVVAAERMLPYLKANKLAEAYRRAIRHGLASLTA